MGAVRLGKLLLRWCDRCNVPVLEMRACGRCEGPTREVTVTPPGDIRPAFAYDVDLVRKTLDGQFGEGCGEAAIPPDKNVVLLNKCPALDRMDEVIVDGMVLGSLRYDLRKGYEFVPRLECARRVAATASRGVVTIDDGAVKPVSDGASAMAVGIREADPDIAPGDEVLVLDRRGSAVAAGKAKMSGREMVEATRGSGVKNRWNPHNSPGSGKSSYPNPAWDDAIEANGPLMDREVERAGAFIRDIVERNGLPVAVSFSGGKDSLATLLLVLDAGLRPKLLFTNTGLEFPETVGHVRDIAGEFGLELLEEEAGDVFWRDLPDFGPPGKDFRWCCKTCKLGPTTRLITRHFPDGVLSFIGQRSYESEQRMRKGGVWRNPWVPNQVGASPIQKWTALHVWLYIFMKGVRYNPLYERGLERIGCFLCPASDVAELELVRASVGRFGDYDAFLAEHARRKGASREWLDLDLWRWKRPPGSVMELLGDARLFEPGGDAGEGEPSGLRFKASSGYAPCTGGVSVEGAFNRRLDLDRLKNYLNVLGEPRLDDGMGMLEVGPVRVFAEGSVIARGHEEGRAREVLVQAADAVRRGLLCVGCGICLGRCPHGAIKLEAPGRVRITKESCAHCAECLDGPCPATSFGRGSREEPQDGFA